MPDRIYIVEDHPVMRAAYRNVLSLEPDLHLCGEAASAEEALEALATATCDIVVTDMRLPGMSGAELVGALRGTLPDVPVLVVSAHNEGLYARHAREAGAVGFLPKRDLARTLAGAIRDVLREREGSERRRSEVDA